MSVQGKSLEDKLKPLFLLCGICGIGSFRKSKKIMKFYVSVLLIFHIVNYIYYSIRFKGHGFGVLDSANLCTFFLLIFGCVTMHISTTFTEKSNFFNLMDLFDSQVNVIIDKQKLFWTAVIFERVEVLVMIIIEIFEWIHMKFSNPGFPGLLFASLLLDTTRLLIYCISIELYSRFRVLVQLLTDTFNLSNNLTRMHRIIPTNQYEHCLKTVKKVSMLHNTLCDELEMVNKIYGFTMVFHVVLSIGSIVGCFSTMIILFVLHNRYQSWWFYFIFCTEMSVSTRFNVMVLIIFAIFIVYYLNTRSVSLS